MKERTAVESHPKFPAFHSSGRFGDINVGTLPGHLERAHTNKLRDFSKQSNPSGGAALGFGARSSRSGGNAAALQNSQISWSSGMSHPGIWQLPLFLREFQPISPSRDCLRTGKRGTFLPQNAKKMENSQKTGNSSAVFPGICASVPCGKLRQKGGNIFRISGSFFFFFFCTIWDFPTGHSQFEFIPFGGRVGFPGRIIMELIIDNYSLINTK